MAWFVTMDSRNRSDENETYLSPEIEVIPEEQQRFEHVGEGFANQIFADCRAAGKDPYDHSLVLTEPFFPYWSPFLFPPPMEGWRWPVPDHPFRDRLKRREGRLVDIIGTSFRTYAVSQRVIDIIESIEPGVHQYLPYDLICKDGSVHPDRRWLLNVCTRIQALDLSLSNVIALKSLLYYFDDKAGNQHLVVKKSAVEGRALWFEYRYWSTAGQFLLTDRFWNALQEAGCAGWRPDSGQRGAHIEEI